MDIPEGKHLGTLCKSGHNWNNTEKSLRNNHGQCAIHLREIKTVGIGKI